MDLKELYQDIILEHGKSPRNYGKFEGYNHQAKGHNPLWVDQIQIFVNLRNLNKTYFLHLFNYLYSKFY